MRRRVGLGAIQKQQLSDSRFKEKSGEIAAEQLAKLKEQLEQFRLHLQNFAAKHKKAIRKDPQFRKSFQEMCLSVGVDPLQSSNNFWSKLLGIGDYYYELAIQVIEVCISTSKINGGLIKIEDVQKRLQQSRKYNIRNKSKSDANVISIDDIVCAIEKLSVLGGGLKLFKFDRSYLIQSIGNELSMDANDVLSLAQNNNGNFDHSLLYQKLKWTDERINKVITDLIMDGVIWIDNQTESGSPLYWFPSLS